MWSIRLILASTLLAAVTGDGRSQSMESAPTFFRIRRDFRRCVSPVCGGFFVKSVNQRLTHCAGGEDRAECYVAEADWSQLGLSGRALSAFLQEVDSGRTVVRGSVQPKQYGGFGNLGLFAATEGWRPASAVPAAGTIFSVQDNGIRCFTFPCFSLHEAMLNSEKHKDISEVDLSGVGADEATLAAASQAIAYDLLLVAGGNEVVFNAGPAGIWVLLNAPQFWLRVVPSKP